MHRYTAEGLPAIGRVRALGCPHVYPLRRGERFSTLALAEWVGYVRPDGSRGEAGILVTCEACREKMGEPPTRVDRVDFEHEGLWEPVRGWVERAS